MESAMNTTMLATVCKVECCKLCVCDMCNQQEVVVHYQNACCFHVGDCVCIHYNGIMAQSMPPQITATCIEHANR